MSILGQGVVVSLSVNQVFACRRWILLMLLIERGYPLSLRAAVISEILLWQMRLLHAFSRLGVNDKSN